jgi:hypothetical protein
MFGWKKRSEFYRILIGRSLELELWLKIDLKRHKEIEIIGGCQ